MVLRSGGGTPLSKTTRTPQSATVWTRAMEALRGQLAALEGRIAELSGRADPIARLEPRVAALEDNVGEGDDLGGTVTDLLKAIRLDVATLKDDVVLIKRQLVSLDAGPVNEPRGKMKVPEPKAFDGTRSSKELENFIWDMENYFAAAKIPDAEKVMITTMYLAKDAKLWWRTRVQDDLSAGRPRMETWEALKKELKEQFLPSNTAWLARDAMAKLRHNGPVRDYVKEFSALMLDVTDMSETDKLYTFLKGLQPWAQLELRRQGVRDLPSALAAADALLDLRIARAEEGSKKTQHMDKDKKSKSFLAGKSGKGKEKQLTRIDKGKARVVEAANGRKDPRTHQGCFICNGPHRAKECPKREGKVTALRSDDSDEDQVQRVAPLQALGAMRSERPKVRHSLLFVDVTLNGRQMSALVDTGATNTFVSDRMIRTLELRVERSRSRLKAVNSKSQPMGGLARDVPIKIEAWEGTVDLMVVPLMTTTSSLGIASLQMQLSPSCLMWEALSLEIQDDPVLCKDTEALHAPRR